MIRWRWSAFVALTACLVASACSTGGCGFIFGVGQEPSGQAANAAATGNPNAPAPRPKIVALGDSLTVGLGLLESESYPSLLQNKLDEDGYAVRDGQLPASPETHRPAACDGSTGRSTATFASSSSRLAPMMVCVVCPSPR